MSDVIKLLPDHIANQIAAGEVIQRPASVVKEMVENAIDAGATKIRVIIKDAGKTLIQIVDNGWGMSPADALMSFERHATSKVTRAEDLFSLSTKGFRGEALASIAAISHVTLKSKRPVDETGTRIIIEGGKCVANEVCVCPDGTSFEVKNLFFNVPARRNFLKSDNVEFNHIMDEFERIALAHPDLSFALYHNDQEMYNLPSAVRRKRIVDIIGKNSNDKLVPIEESTEIVEVIGYVGKPQYAKKTRGEQFFFVNDRFFKDTYFSHALIKAFDGLIQPKYFPSFFLYLKVDPSKIDVNVHPTKTEIKFEEDRLIYAILLSSVRQALGKYNIAPTLDFEPESSFNLPYDMKNQPIVEPTIKVDPSFNPFQTSASRSGNSGRVGNSFTKAINAEGFGSTDLTSKDWENFYKIEDDQIEKEHVDELDLDVQEKKQYLFRGKYIITTTKSGFLLIDSSRAIERIIYDEMINQFISRPIDSQTLLFPIERELSSNESRGWAGNYSMMERLGFLGTVNDQVLQLLAVPSVLQEEAIYDCLDLIFENIAFKEIDKGEVAHVIVQSISTAAGKKRTYISNNEAASALIEQLFRCAEHVYTPSGKKILETISIDEIAQRF
ncbi:MAG: DNA mismatch repair endonuclease MutL [Flavobacteriia bacterium]